MLYTEEDIKTNILLPFIQDLGFNKNDLEFERTFTIRLGKTVHKKENQKSGRLDILCHKNGQNLFVIEVKAPSVKIDQDDIDQGISYARLLDNIAPFVIVTNGKDDTRIIDTITKSDITGSNISQESDFWKNKCTLSMDKDIAIRFEALSNFISFSEENLKIFSNGQQLDRMGTLNGYDVNPDAKYNLSLHIIRPKLEQEYNLFLESNDSVFALIGESGVGKTNAVCHLCLNESQNSINLFYNGTLLSQSIIDCLATDFNLFFSSSQQRLKILPSIDDVARNMDKKIIIFIDALDEIQIPNFKRELGEFALNIKHLNNIKLCVSCKVSIWNEFLFINGEKSYLYELVSKSHNYSDKKKAPGFVVERFDKLQSEEAITKFFQAYNITGDVSRDLHEDFKHGLFLHLFCQVFQGQEIPKQIPFDSLLQKFIDYNLSKIEDPSKQMIIPILSVLGKLIIESENEESPGVSISHLKESVGLRILEQLPNQLFSHNILIKNEQDGELYISFYYSRLRDYIIIKFSYGLKQLSDQEFDLLIPAFLNGNIGKSVLQLYSRVAQLSHLKILNNHFRTRLTSYVEKYEEYLNTNFPNTKASFDPYTLGSIGIIVPKDLLSGNEAYALFPIDKTKESTPKYIEDENIVSLNNVIFEKYNAKTIHGSFGELINNDLEKTVTNNIFSQLKRILENQELNEASSVELLIEKVVHLIYNFREKLGLNYQAKESHFPRLENIYPIDLDDIKKRIYKFFVTEYYVEENIKQQIKDGRIQVKNNVYSYSSKQLDWDKINSKVQLAIENDSLIEVITSNNTFIHLGDCIDLLLNKGIVKIENHYLPLPDIPVLQIKDEVSRRNGRIGYIPAVIIAQFSQEKIKLYIKEFIRLFEKSYSEFVEANFPTIKDQFKFYSSIPHRYIIFYDGQDDLSKFRFGIGYKDSKAISLSFEFTTFENWHNKFEIFDITKFKGSNITDLFWDHRNSHRIAKQLNKSKIEEFLTLRSWVYNFLKDDFKQFIETNNIEIK